MRYLYWFFKHVSRVFGAFALLTLTVPAQVLAVTWRSVAEVAVFSPILRFSR